MPSQIDTFIENLATAPTAPDATNEYAHTDDPNNTIRRDNLRRYLNHMAGRSPRAMIVMEAPGYRGCRLTGVPVTSRKVLLEGVPELAIFGTEQGYQNVDDAGFERIYGEQSATIVWGTLTDLGVLPLIWNTFPFHPHKPDQPLTNRRPRKDEMTQGAGFLRTLLDLFVPQMVVAIGNVAHETLTQTVGLDCVKVRHPAQGGKNDFVAGLTALRDELGS